jgi:hypothetical protein
MGGLRSMHGRDENADNISVEKFEDLSVIVR